MAISTEAEDPHAVRSAAADTLGVGLGLYPLGVAFGVLLVQSGFDWWWAPVFSLLIYAGSLEFLAIGLFLALTPLASVAVTTFLVNFRHVFYGLSFPLHRVRGRAAKAYSVYALTDEAYALAAARPGLTGRRIVAVQAFCQAYWVLGGVTGRCWARPCRATSAGWTSRSPHCSRCWPWTAGGPPGTSRARSSRCCARWPRCCWRRANCWWWRWGCSWRR
ncbi:AzlC family ABC transporter permease [Kitasatospora cheerisanensis]|uniref:AzlC family ABC transporter permease n=1 Tax=Kitasatospora cheerisanensis TaxID=81942 RepID=UPI001FCC2C91|nr:AzlC family ABC transporter permease [Kitasatospora cheerisanensis]